MSFVIKVLSKCVYFAACVNIPNQWQLSGVHLNTEPFESSTSDASLADWEII